MQRSRSPARRVLCRLPRCGRVSLLRSSPAPLEFAALFFQLFELFLVTRFEFCEFFRVIEGRLIVEFVVAPFAARDAGRRFLENAHIDRGRGGVGEVEILIGDQTVDDRAGIFPFRLILLGNGFPRFGEGKVFAPSAADRSAPIGCDIAVLFQPLEGAVEGGLFERILTVALALDLCDDLVAVLVAVVECAQDDRVDVPADQVGTDRFFGAFFQYDAFVHAVLLCFFLHYI